MMRKCRFSLRSITAVMLVGGTLALTQGCSSTPRPDAEVAGASAALMSAESSEATLYAPVPMDRAKDKLRRAQQAIERKDFDEARRLSEEAQADAELAHAITSKTRAQTALSDLETSIEMLRSEILRGQQN